MRSTEQDELAESAPSSVQARVVKDCLPGVYSLSKEFPRAEACPSIPGLTPRHFRGADSEDVLKNEIGPRIIKGESIVLLGNSNADLKWILESLPIDDDKVLNVHSPTHKAINWIRESLSIQNEKLLTVYSPTSETMKESEKSLKNYLTHKRGSNTSSALRLGPWCWPMTTPTAPTSGATT